jgi:N-methylhydantoinase A/oxoprolinase/acetone carboxylase beta subunit
LLDTAIYAYDDLAVATAVPGPAIVERESTTIWLPPDTRATMDEYGNLIVELV